MNNLCNQLAAYISYSKSVKISCGQYFFISEDFHFLYHGVRRQKYLPNSSLSSVLALGVSSGCWPLLTRTNIFKSGRNFSRRGHCLLVKNF